jgi:hypothetical protein
VQAAADLGGIYVPITPVRILDTRIGQGARPGPLGPHESIDLGVVGSVAAVPADALAVVMNVTVTDPDDASFLTLWPAAEGRPLASNLNWIAGRTIPNLTITRLGAGGRVSIYNDAGTTQVLADVAGYFEPDTSHVGPAGPQGPAGPRGPSGVAAVVWNRSGAIDVDASGVGDGEGACPGDTHVLSGGGIVLANGDSADTPGVAPRAGSQIVASYPTDHNTWRVVAEGAQHHDDLYITTLCVP